MKKNSTKLLAAVILTVISATLVGVVSYAWFALSVAPEAGGLTVNIGGGDTVLIAPDVTDSAGNHSPGEFGYSLDFSDYFQYSYLKSVAGLMPVSTSDGKTWILPSYFTQSDEAVKNGDAKSGDLKDISEFTAENDLSHANLSDTDAEARSGNYIYVDFWISAPKDYDVRLASGDSKNAGSFALTVPKLTKIDGKWQLDFGAVSKMQNFVRVGFLTEDSSFVIYEPNGTSSVPYAVTEPLSFDGNNIVYDEVSDNLAVQAPSSWREDSLNSHFADFRTVQSSVDGKNIDEMNENTVSDLFFNNFIHGQYRPYVVSGQFYKSASMLYKNGNYTETSGAASDGIIVRLKKNVPQKIRMFIWLEGQDPDCVDGQNESTLAVHIELAGSN